MTGVYLSWRGVIAYLDAPTTDGRILRKSGVPAGHFPAMPVPVFARRKRDDQALKIEPAGEHAAPVRSDPAASLIVGRIDRVSLRPAEWPRKGTELYAEGMITLDDLLTVRPDLQPEGVSGGESPKPWPVGIEVRNGTFEGDPNAGDLAVSGPWELAAMMIEEDPAVWPGVGIELIGIEYGG